ncbi:MAG: FAD-dependent oxidoreductase [Deltaproteobacteria bacterium]|nr:FAD-dependent oxidoreductase [Deltaproteobacteria bacterium]
MEKLSSLAELRALQERIRDERDPTQPTVVIPSGTCGQASGASDLIRIAKREILGNGLAAHLRLRITGCRGYCEMEPFVVVEPRGTFYPKVRPEDMASIVQAAAHGEVLPDRLYREPISGARFEQWSEIPFFKRQRRTLLLRNDRVDPIQISDYLENGGYSSLARVLELEPAAAIEEMKASGLRGRGGAGFPTGLKWELLAKQESGTGKYLVCNADEGDPGAYMDRAVLEGNPQSIIEGMLIGAFATCATEGIIYVRSEYPLAIKHLVIALRQARALGLLGDGILGTALSFDIRLARGAGAFVCGEETALMRSVEGLVGEPRQRPPYPVERGIGGKPTAINNVETWANVPVIFERSAAEFASVGTPKSRGTKIFSLVGKIRNTGLVEVPMGMTIGEIVHDIGGGPRKGDLKAVQTGGPSGGCIPARLFDLPIDYDTLARAGSIMGSGGMIVLDDETCMVDVARYFTAFLEDESCGKCFTCRKGTQRMHEILEDITHGRATVDHLDLLEELAAVVQDTTMCGLGQTASNPVSSTLRYFRSEYLRHIVDKRCDAFACRDLVGAPCQSACPLGTEAWRYVAHIARQDYEEAYRVLRESNPFPSVCARVCNHPCETRCRSGSLGGEPIAVRALKRFLTDRVDPSMFVPKRSARAPAGARVAVVGAGPAGLAAAHYLALEGHEVTLFEAAERPGGTLRSGIPPYRLPHDVLDREIAAIVSDPLVTLRCGQALGRDFTIEGLLGAGCGAVLLALGAHRSLALGLEGEDAAGVFPAMRLLEASNLRGEWLARGRVGVIGGGNAAVDAARVALRQPEVDSVTIYYRRTRREMPAFRGEILAALEEGVQLVELVTPMRLTVREGRLTGLDMVHNELGERDESGRRKPVPVPGTRHTVPLETLIVAIREECDSSCLSGEQEIQLGRGGTVRVDRETLETDRRGVFAAGDAIRGPDTVVDAIADGKRAARTIGCFLRGEMMRRPAVPVLPEVWVEHVPLGDDELDRAKRPAAPSAPPESRRRSFVEVEQVLSERAAVAEARRCLRCDLDFTRPRELVAQHQPAEASR